MTTLAFDVYGTLIDTYGMTDLLQRFIGKDKARAFALMWRDKQLEYSFRRSLMNRYEPFYQCTSDALTFCIAALDVAISTEQRDSLIERYLNLPVYGDVVDSLEALSQRNDIHIYALSNGPRSDVEKLFEGAAIEHYFEDIVSADEVRKYKPDPAVYQHFLDRSGAGKRDSWLISSNAFDVIGAGSFGMNTVWVKRTELQHMDPWGEQPTHTVRSLSELDTLF